MPHDAATAATPSFTILLRDAAELYAFTLPRLPLSRFIFRLPLLCCYAATLMPLRHSLPPLPLLAPPMLTLPMLFAAAVCAAFIFTLVYAMPP